MEWLEPARCYLKQDTYPGECRFIHKDQCKALGAKWRDNKWTALDKPTLLALCDSGLWHARGMGYEANIIIVKLLRKEQTDREEAEMKARVKRSGPTDEEKKLAKLKEFGIPPDEPKLLEELASKGITKDMAARSVDYSWLGPRSGISNAERLLRGLRFKLVTVEDVVADTAQEPFYSTGKRGAAQAGVSAKAKFDSGRSAQANGPKRERKEKPEPPPPPPQEDGNYAEPVSSGQWVAKRVRVEYVDSVVCDDCGVLVDRREQFGMQCDCEVVKMWRSCVRCLRPVPGVDPSPMCDGCK